MQKPKCNSKQSLMLSEAYYLHSVHIKQVKTRKKLNTE